MYNSQYKQYFQATSSLLEQRVCVAHFNQTEDIITTKVLKGKVAVRSSGYFNIQTKSNVIQGISFKCSKMVHKTMGIPTILRRIPYKNTIIDESIKMFPLMSESHESPTHL